MVLRWMFLTILATALALPLFALPVLAGQATVQDSSGPVVPMDSADHAQAVAVIDSDFLHLLDTGHKTEGKAVTEGRVIDLLHSLAKRHDGGDGVKAS